MHWSKRKIAGQVVEIVAMTINNTTTIPTSPKSTPGHTATNNKLPPNCPLPVLKRIHMQPTVAIRIMSRFGILACSKTPNKLKVPQARDRAPVLACELSTSVRDIAMTRKTYWPCLMRWDDLIPLAMYEFFKSSIGSKHYFAEKRVLSPALSTAHAGLCVTDDCDMNTSIH